MSRAENILELIDAGLGHAAGWAAPIKSTSCARAGCKAAPVEAHDFCAPCLAWLRGDADDDPLNLPDDNAQDDDDDPIVRWVELFGGAPL